MAGKLEIINVALGRLGADPIISEIEGTKQQIIATTNFDTTRQALLREHPWNFAMTDLELARAAGTPSFKFKYAYQLPSNCLRLLEVYDTRLYKVQGKFVFSDNEVCKARFVKDIPDPNLWDAAFTDVFGYRLAADMGYSMGVAQSNIDSLYMAAQQRMRTARHIDATEEVLDSMDGDWSSLIQARF